MTLTVPPQVAALPHTRTGVPITWAAAWSSEMDTLTVRPDPLLEPILGTVLAYFTEGAPGKGDPHIAQPHPERVRRCTIEGLCQVCGGQLGDGPRWLCDIRLGEEWFRVGKTLVPLLIDAWTCNGCIDYSLHACPNLSKRDHLDVLRVHTWLLIPSLERPKWIPDTVPYGPIGFVKIAALSYDRFPVVSGGSIDLVGGE